MIYHEQCLQSEAKHLKYKSIPGVLRGEQNEWLVKLPYEYKDELDSLFTKAPNFVLAYIAHLCDDSLSTHKEAINEIHA